MGDSREALAQALAVCAGATLGILACLILLGAAIFGLWDVISSLPQILAIVVRIPFADRAASGASGLYGTWLGIRTLLFWGAIAFAVLIVVRPPITRGWPGLFGRLQDQRTYSRSQRQQATEYRRLYAEAVRQGQPAPAPPPALSPAFLAGGGSSNAARTGYWLVRIAIVIVGAFGLYGLLAGSLSDRLLPLLLGNLFGR